MPTQAKIWRVDNDAARTADFRTLQQAHDDATAGDTLYVAGSASGYSSLLFLKKLTVVGPGYFLDENADLQARPLSARTSGIEFASGAEGSAIIGMDIRNPILVWVGPVTIMRNRITNTNGFSKPLIELKSNIKNAIISQNYIHNEYKSSLSHGIELELGLSNIIIKNNYIRADSTGGADAISMLETSAAEITHNVIDGDLLLANSTFYNNILVAGTYVATATDTRNNIGAHDQFSSAGGNLQNVAMSAVFVGTGSSDGRWQLTPASAASAAGSSGVDMGIYGGATPYVLSGLPPIPAIYFFSAPSSGSPASGLPIELKIRSVN